MRQGKGAEALIVLVAYATTGMLGVYIGVFQYTVWDAAQLFQKDVSFVGVLISMQSFGMMVSPLSLGAQSSRIGKRKVMLIALLLLAGSAVFAGATPSAAGFVAAVFLIGAGFAVTEATVTAILADEFPDKALRHMSFSQVAFCVGALLSPVAAERLIGVGVFFKHLYPYIAILFVLLWIAYIFMRQRNDAVAQRAVATQNIASLLKNRVFLMLAFCVFIYVGIECVVAGFADSFFVLVAGDAGFSALAISLFWGAMIPSRFLAGAIGVGWEKKMVASLAVSFAAIAGGMLAPWHAAKLSMFALCGFGFGPVWPLLMSEAARGKSGSSGLEMNAMIVFCASGGVLFPLLSGGLAEASSPAAAYWLSAFCLAAILILSLMYSRAPKR